MINRLFTTMVSNVGNNIQDTSSGTQTVIKRMLNDVYFDFLRRVNWRSINYTYTLTCVAGTQDYVLSNDFGKELYVYDSNNLRDIPFIFLEQMESKRPGRLATQGTVDSYTLFDSPVRVQPSSSSTLSVVSSSSTDTSQMVRIKGIDSSGIELEESISLNGTTSVPTVNSYSEIRSISKSASTTGKVTIISNGGSLTNAIMSPADLDYKVKIMRFQDIPGNVILFKIPYYRRPSPLTNDNDVPVIDCCDVLEDGATAKMWRYKRQFAKAQEFERLYEKGIVQVAWDKENQPNQTQTLNVRPYSRNDY